MTEEELAAKAKAKAKAKGKAADEPEEAVRPNGVILLGYLSEIAQHAPWEVALRGFTSTLLRTNDGEVDLQSQLSAIIAPWSFQELDTQDYLNLPALPGSAPLHLLRLRHHSHTEMCNKVLCEAENEKAWQAGDFAPSSDAPPDDGKGKGKGKKPAGKDA